MFGFNCLTCFIIEKLHQASGAAVLAKRQLSLSKQKAAKQVSNLNRYDYLYFSENSI